MTQDHTALLRNSIDRVVRIVCTDGEVISARIDVVDEQVGEIVFELLSTTDQAKYEKFDRQPAYLMRFAEISSVEVVSGGQCVQ